MSAEGTVEVVITALTALTAQQVFFPGRLGWVRFKNDSPIRIRVLDHSGAKTLVNVWPGDVIPFSFGSRDYNSLLLYGDVPSLAADIAAGDILYIEYSLKRW